MFLDDDEANNGGGGAAIGAVLEKKSPCKTVSFTART